jgi:hypothetical protein
MGIRTICPNGHPLNLKSFLAGKIGICPQCGAKFRIPRDADAIREDTPAVGTHPLTPQDVTTPVSTHEARAEESPAESNVWYVCLPDRQTYGPIPRATVDRWIVEGRLTQDSLVWCDAWTQWRPIATLVAVPATTPVVSQTTPPTSDRPPPETVPLAPTETVPVADQIRRRRHRRALSTTVTIATILTVVCLALIAVLVWVLQ